MSKLVSFGENSRLKLLEGINIMADAVGSTLGPSGRNVVIEREDRFVHITKDGVTVAKNISFLEPYKNLGAKILKQVAQKSVADSGDGTTTSVVLARAIYSDGLSQIKDGRNAVEVSRGINLAAKAIIEHLSSKAKKIRTAKDVRNVAMIASNGDSKVGNLIFEAYKKVSKDGMITIEESGNEESFISISEGYEFMNGYLHKGFINVPKKQKVEMEKPFILVSDKKLEKQQELLPLVQGILNDEANLVIICKDMTADVLQWLLYLKMNQGLKVAVCKGPAFGDRRLELLEDLAIYTGAQLYRDTDEHIYQDMLGQAVKITMNGTHTSIMEGYGAPEAIAERLDYIKSLTELEEFASSGYKIEKLQERISKLGAQVAVIRVGGVSELEVNELKDRVEDAIQATRCAISEGILPGGGMALYKSSEEITIPQNISEDTKLGFRIVVDACKAPANTIAHNCGRTTEKVDLSNYNSGWDMRNYVYYDDLMKAGVVDPLTVVKSALKNSCSIAGLLLTTECVITNVPDKEQEAFFKELDFNEELFEN